MAWSEKARQAAAEARRRKSKQAVSTKQFREALAAGRTRMMLGTRVKRTTGGNQGIAAVRRLRGTTVSTDSRMTAGWASSIAKMRDTAMGSFLFYRNRGLSKKTAYKYAKNDVRDYARHSPEDKIAASFAFRKPPKLTRKRK